MVRVKGGVHAAKRRRKLLSKTKGYRNERKSKERSAKVAWVHAGAHAFAHRKDKKADFRRLWQIKINAGARAHGVSYSRLLRALKEKKVGLNRKMLAEFAEHAPETFARVIKHAS